MLSQLLPLFQLVREQSFSWSGFSIQVTLKWAWSPAEPSEYQDFLTKISGTLITDCPCQLNENTKRAYTKVAVLALDSGTPAFTAGDDFYGCKLDAGSVIVRLLYFGYHLDVPSRFFEQAIQGNAVGLHETYGIIVEK